MLSEAATVIKGSDCNQKQLWKHDQGDEQGRTPAEGGSGGNEGDSNALFQGPVSSRGRSRVSSRGGQASSGRDSYTMFCRASLPPVAGQGSGSGGSSGFGRSPPLLSSQPTHSPAPLPSGQLRTCAARPARCCPSSTLRCRRRLCRRPLSLPSPVALRVGAVAGDGHSRCVRFKARQRWQRAWRSWVQHQRRWKCVASFKSNAADTEVRAARALWCPRGNLGSRPPPHRRLAAGTLAHI